MAGIGRDLVVNLAGNNSKLKSSLRESSGGLKSFASSAASLLNPVTAGLAAVAGAAIGAGVAIYGLTANIEKLDKVAKDAARTGVSGAFLQQLSFAADQSGVSLEQLTVGIKKLTVAIGKGDDKPFAALKISIEDLKKLNPEQQFLKVADAIGKLPTAAERAAASVKIFGKSGIEMTTLFSSGMDGINKLMERAAELHIGVSGEGLAKVQAANDAIGQMKASFGALIDQVTVGLAPVFTLVATAIADMIPPLTEFFDKFGGLEDKVGFVGDLFESGMAVAFASIEEHWDTMLGEMILAAKDAGVQIAKNLNPATAIGERIGGAIGRAVGGPEAAPGESKLDAAKRNFEGVMERLNQPKPDAFVGPVMPLGGRPKDDGSKLSALAGEFSESAMGLFSKASRAARDKVGDIKQQAGFLGSVAKNIFTGEPKESPESGPVKRELRFAGAMQKGSAEAYSTIVQAMFRGKDPNVQATEKQTVAIVKALKENKTPKFAKVEAFA